MRTRTLSLGLSSSSACVYLQSGARAFCACTRSFVYSPKNNAITHVPWHVIDHDRTTHIRAPCNANLHVPSASTPWALSVPFMGRTSGIFALLGAHARARCACKMPKHRDALLVHARHTHMHCTCARDATHRGAAAAARASAAAATHANLEGNTKSARAVSLDDDCDVRVSSRRQRLMETIKTNGCVCICICMKHRSPIKQTRANVIQFYATRRSLRCCRRFLVVVVVVEARVRGARQLYCRAYGLVSDLRCSAANSNVVFVQFLSAAQ